MWFASALLSGEQTVVSTSYGSTKPWQSAFVTLSITRILLDLHSVILRCSYGQTDSRTDCHPTRRLLPEVKVYAHSSNVPISGTHVLQFS